MFFVGEIQESMGNFEFPIPRIADDEEHRLVGAVVLDLERLEGQAEDLYLHKFVEYVKKVRGEHGRYLTLRAGDEIAIQAAADGSAESLQDVLTDNDATDD